MISSWFDRATRGFLLSGLLFGLVVSGCDCEPEKGNSDAGLCAATGDSCDTLLCCGTDVCDQTTQLCGPPAACVPSGQSCETGACCGSDVCDGTTKLCGPAPTCAGLGEPCGTECCQGLACDQVSVVCTLPPSLCKATGVTCANGTDCCSNACVASSCAAACVQNGQPAATDTACCSGFRSGANCAAVPGTVCGTTGNACTTDAGCCTGNCVNNVCMGTGAACVPQGDTCFDDLDCCSFHCSGTGGNAGICDDLPGLGSVGGGCNYAGEPCSASNCSACCTAACGPAPGGGSVCSRASGCQPEGEICTDNNDCCGGYPANSPEGMMYPDSAGHGVCQKNSAGDAFGRCVTSAGVPIGSICKATTPLCGGSGTSNPAACDDCNISGAKWQCCQLDTLGIARCSYDVNHTPTCPNGIDGTAGCCTDAGAVCVSSDQCCNGAPCLQDGSGVYRCGSMCSPADGACQNTGDCCTGLTCVIESGTTVGKCMAPPITTPPGGGPPPMTCSAQAQSCAFDTDCCAGMNLRCYDYMIPGFCAGGGSCVCAQVLEP